MPRSKILEQYELRTKAAKSDILSPAAATPGDRLEHWAARVIKRQKRAAHELRAESVHDLRTALRRCLSIKDAIARFDPDPRWKKMNHTAKNLLRSLSGLRDSDVLIEWLKKLPIARGAKAATLRRSIEVEREDFKQQARIAIRAFDQEKWNGWAAALAPRADFLPADGPELRYVALEQWQRAYERHCFAMRSRSKLSYHRTRVALKKLRYTVENFLPGIQERWGDEAKQLQTLLGEVHDLDVLWSKFLELGRPISNEEKKAWQSAINSERSKRLKQYASKTSGKNSVFFSWRKSLPDGCDLEQAVLAELGAWARFRTPEFVHQQRVATLAAELFDALAERGFAIGLPTERARSIIQAAALVEDAGRINGEKGHHKESYRMIRKMRVPIGWKASELQLLAAVARYHRKALPQAKHKEFSGLPSAFQQAILLLAGILRLANAFEQAPNGIRKLNAEVTLEGLMVRAYGFDGEEPLLSRIATAKHLLEVACRSPIVVTPGAAGAPLRVSGKESLAHTDAA